MCMFTHVHSAGHVHKEAEGCQWVLSWLALTVNFGTAESHLSRKSQLRNCSGPVGLWTCLRGIEGPSLLCAAPISGLVVLSCKKVS